jgi:hypothetical protein
MANLDALYRELKIGDATVDKKKACETFVYHRSFEDILYPDKFAILIGRKGSGKSALLAYAERIQDEYNLHSISIDPTKLLFSGSTPPGKDSSISQVIAYYYMVILRSIAASLGKSVKFSVFGDDCLDEAKLQGARESDIIENLAKLFSNLKFKNGWVPDVQLPRISQPVVESLKRSVSKMNDFQVFIDDIDTAGDFNTVDGLNKIYAMIFAARRLTSELSGLKILMSLRYDLWYRIERDKSGLFEIDKLRGHIISYVPVDDQIEAILTSWLKFTKEKYEGNYTGAQFKYYFEGEAVLPDSNDLRDWATFITTYSRQRPRDGMQLISMLAKRSNDLRYDKIKNSVISDVMTSYSKQRVVDLKNEFSFACPTLEKVIAGFEGTGWIIKWDKLDKKLAEIIIEGVNLRGEPLSPDKIQSRILLLDFLYEIGFINPKVYREDMPKGFEFLYHNRHPNLISEANVKHLLTLEWHIHPGYRDYLKSKSREMIPY